MLRRYEGQHSWIIFDDFVLEPFEVTGSLDQGDVHSDLANIPAPEEDEHGVIFVDDNTLVTVGADFHETHQKIRDIVQRPGGVNAWAAWHNAKFGPARCQLVDMSWHRVTPPFQPKKCVLEPRFGLRLGPHVIKSVTSAKLLWVHIDQELRWKEQGGSALSKGQVWLAQGGRLTRTSRGICVGPM
ncbi:hypothetical protein C8R45DRAFT_1100803 [Mycena sanguinolenta]|nr:hypothetical protein C8R45DRAFT_1100803 [Mycena sanguinolenta]